MNDMDSFAPAENGFSANVRIRLLIDETSIPLASVGPNSGEPVEPVEIPVGAVGVLVISVDGREHQWDVVVENGAFPPIDKSIRFKMCGYRRSIPLLCPLT
ncbi:MAG TPA: hypothetical protein VL475_08425 [Planctomycetaceae bacterium]|jgi:hypothetical protein|nr:hypothetical protein [Planctomycetaceae bacterium]